MTPNIPYVFLPQHLTCPAAVTAQVALYAAASDTALFSGVPPSIPLSTKTLESDVSPSPSWP